MGSHSGDRSVCWCNSSLLQASHSGDRRLLVRFQPAHLSRGDHENKDREPSRAGRAAPGHPRPTPAAPGDIPTARHSQRSPSFFACVFLRSRFDAIPSGSAGFTWDFSPSPPITEAGGCLFFTLQAGAIVATSEQIRNQQLLAKATAIAAIQILKARGVTYRGICRTLQEAGVTPPCGRPGGTWHMTTIRRLTEQYPSPKPRRSKKRT